MANPDFKVKVTRTVTITQTHSSKSYPDMTAQQVVEYEKYMPDEEKLQQFSEALQFAHESDIEVSEEVTIFPVV